jgi:hypothetical protein
MMGAFTNRSNLPPSDTASEGKSYRWWATALPSPTQSVLPLSMNAPVHDWGVLNFGVIWLTEMRGAESAEDM